MASCRLGDQQISAIYALEHPFHWLIYTDYMIRQAYLKIVYLTNHSEQVFRKKVLLSAS